MIKYLENPIYNESNNISSSLVARYLLSNAYVFEADLLISNPSIIKKYHYASDFLGIKNWARDQALRLFNPPKRYALMDCHYYHPDKDPKIHGYNNDGIFNFERELRFAGFQIHYSNRGHNNTPNISLIEDALTFATYRHVDAVILLTTQGQYSPLPDRLSEMGIPTLLLGWNFAFERNNRWVHWKTDGLLRDHSAYYIAMENVANRNPPSDLSDISLFKNRRPGPSVLQFN